MNAAELIERLEALTPGGQWIVTVYHQTLSGVRASATLFLRAMAGSWQYPEKGYLETGSIEPEDDVLEHLFRIVRAGLAESKRAAEARLEEEHHADRAESIMDEIEGGS